MARPAIALPERHRPEHHKYLWGASDRPSYRRVLRRVVTT